MLKTKEELSNCIVSLCKLKMITSRTELQNAISELRDKYDIPEAVSSDVLTLRIQPIEETEFVLYCLLDVLSKGKLIKTYFTDKEISQLSQIKYKVAKIKMPLKYQMIQVAPDQWIGSIHVKDLMLMRNAQLIIYNENAQRTLKRLVAGDTEYYQIDVNYNAVNAIIESYQSEIYIPNTITLNMPETTEFEYKNGELVIKEIDGFDILDGYHRYVAMSILSNLNKKFDYTMELRIVYFSEEKAKQFIWQEDQKTKMSKVDSDALNQVNAGNQVVQLLNKGILQNTILRNGGTIDASVMSQLINVLFFNTKKKIDKKQLIETRNIIYDRINSMVECNTDILNKRWDYMFTSCVMYLIANTDLCDDELCEQANLLYKKVKDNKDIFNGRNISIQVISRLSKLYNS